MWNLKNNANKSIYKTKTDSKKIIKTTKPESQTLKTIYGYQRKEGGQEGEIKSMGLTDTDT